NVASMKLSARSRSPRSRIRFAKRRNTFCSRPSRTHCWKRRWQVWYGGYRSGISLQRDPLPNTHNTPLSTPRVSCQGRPRPSSRRCGFKTGPISSQSWSLTSQPLPVRLFGVPEHSHHCASRPGSQAKSAPGMFMRWVLGLGRSGACGRACALDQVLDRGCALRAAHAQAVDEERGGAANAQFMGERGVAGDEFSRCRTIRAVFEAVGIETGLLPELGFGGGQERGSEPVLLAVEEIVKRPEPVLALAEGALAEASRFIGPGMHGQGKLAKNQAYVLLVPRQHLGLQRHREAGAVWALEIGELDDSHRSGGGARARRIAALDFGALRSGEVAARGCWRGWERSL